MSNLEVNQDFETTIKITSRAIEKIKSVTQMEASKNKFLRITIDSGGCNGFQYSRKLDDNINQDDVIIYQEGKKIIAVTDKMSEEFLKNSEIDFIEDLGGSDFKISNPNASAKCGCGSSFSI
jgi:iron-sulfur cluster insertion protein